MEYIPFNKPYITGKEVHYIYDAVSRGHLSGNGYYTKKVQDFFVSEFGFGKVLLTSSCTDALEMIALLLNIAPGDEVIVPSYTFVSSALAFVREGAKIVFVDSSIDNPNLDIDLLERAITSKTKAIVAVHYAGNSCDMKRLRLLCDERGIVLIEDAAQAIGNKLEQSQMYLGGIGDFAAFSFHETKNIQSGEGGLLVVNNPDYFERAEILWEKGTNRSQFFRGQVNKYGWVDIGSSFLASDITAAFLWAQLLEYKEIVDQRVGLWRKYHNYFSEIGIEAYGHRMSDIPRYSDNNAHIFYLIMRDENQRQEFINFLKQRGVMAVFHYQSLHKSDFVKTDHTRFRFVGHESPYTDMYSDRLVRLPLYPDMTNSQFDKVLTISSNWYASI